MSKRNDRSSIAIGLECRSNANSYCVSELTLINFSRFTKCFPSKRWWSVHNSVCCSVTPWMRQSQHEDALRELKDAHEQAKKVALLVRQFNALAPFDAGFNMATYIWRQISVSLAFPGISYLGASYHKQTNMVIFCTTRTTCRFALR